MLESRIRQARERLGWSQADLARRMHVAQPTVSSWEAGKKSPRVKIMARLAGILGVSFEWLSTGRGEMTPSVGAVTVHNGIAVGYVPETDEDERRLLLCYARLKPVQRASLLGFLESLKG